SKLRVDLVDKGRFGESGSSSVCLWGIAAATSDEDSPELFFEDWVRYGCYISEQNLVREVTTKSKKMVEDLEALGLAFIKNTEGRHHLNKGLGHGVARSRSSKPPYIVAALRAEAKRRDVHIHEGIMITRLLQRNGRVIGALGVSQNGEFFIFNTKAVILAAGGANFLYYPHVDHIIRDPRYHTTGDAFSLAFTAGASLIDMEFAQFRDSPTGVARFGGRYLNVLGERFMERYAPQDLEKASRSKMAESIYREMKAERGPIIWDLEGIRVSDEERETPVVKEFAGKRQIEIIVDFLRLLGGTRINERAESDVPGLFVAGESAGGVHGAGRMQSTSFLATQVFGTNAGRNAAALSLSVERENIVHDQLDEERARIASTGGNIAPAELTQTVQRIMWEQVGVVRDEAGLRNALAKLQSMREEMVPRLSKDNIFSRLEATNLLLTAEMVTMSALTREETRGYQIRDDYPAQDDNWMKHVCISNRRNEIAISTIPVVITPSTAENVERTI
ncbi:FAD-binding protein, partial [Chloroflexota bacterium]